MVAKYVKEKYCEILNYRRFFQCKLEISYFTLLSKKPGEMTSSRLEQVILEKMNLVNVYLYIYYIWDLYMLYMGGWYKSVTISWISVTMETNFFRHNKFSWLTNGDNQILVILQISEVIMVILGHHSGYYSIIGMYSGYIWFWCFIYIIKYLRSVLQFRRNQVVDLH